MTDCHRYNVPAIYLLSAWWVIGAGVGWCFSWAPNVSATWGSLGYGFAGAALATALASYWFGNLYRNIMQWLLWWAFALGSTTVILLLAANRGLMSSSHQLVEAWQALGDFLPAGRNFTATWLGGILLLGIPFWVWSLDNVLSQSRSKTVSIKSQRISFIILLLWFVPIFFVWQKQQTYFQYPYANAAQTGHYRLLFGTAIAISVGQLLLHKLPQMVSHALLKLSVVILAIWIPIGLEASYQLLYQRLPIGGLGVAEYGQFSAAILGLAFVLSGYFLAVAATSQLPGQATLNSPPNDNPTEGTENSAIRFNLMPNIFLAGLIWLGAIAAVVTLPTILEPAILFRSHKNPLAIAEQHAQLRRFWDHAAMQSNGRIRGSLRGRAVWQAPQSQLYWQQHHWTLAIEPGAAFDSDLRNKIENLEGCNLTVVVMDVDNELSLDSLMELRQLGFKIFAAYTTSELEPHKDSLAMVFDTIPRVRDSHIDLEWMNRLTNMSGQLEFSNCTFAPEVIDVAASYGQIFQFRNCLQPEIVNFNSAFTVIEYQDFERIPLSFEQWQDIKGTSRVRVSVIEAPKTLPDYLRISADKQIYFVGDASSPTPPADGQLGQ